MMRITNAMMTSNTKNNININKLNEDRLNTQISTGQVISRPSEDPVVAIRALRLNTNLSQLTQYYKKNIPDCQAWMNVTETALKQTNEIFTSIKENLTTGASDNHTATDRQKILESLKGLRAELYSSGNADYAERTVFTGYRTGESLTFLATDPETKAKSEYQIHELFDVKELEKLDYVTTYDTSAADPSKDVNREEISRIRLAYDNLKCDMKDDGSGTLVPDPATVKFHYFTGDPATENTLDLEVIPTSGKTQWEIDSKIYDYVKQNPKKGVLIPETGEILLGDKIANTIQEGAKANGKQAYIDYNKDQWKSGDLRPEHYFACIQNPADPPTKDTIFYNYDPKVDVSGKPLVPTEPNKDKPNFKNQDLEVEISFNQKITINTHANEVYTHDIGRDIDELIRATQDVVETDERVEDLKRKVESETDPTKKAQYQAQLEAAEKEYSLKKDKMQKMFSLGLDKFDGYADRNNVAIANIGSMQSRLTITKERVADQLQSFKELADSNINAELTESSIDFASAKLALEAAQLAAGKIAQQTLLNYL